MVTFHLGVIMTIKRRVVIGSLLANRYMLDPSSNANIPYLTIIIACIWYWAFPMTVCGLVSDVLGLF